MKKILVSAMAVVIFSSPVSAQAAQFHGEESFVLERSERLSEDLYAAGERVTISGIVDGDAFLASGIIVVDGAVQQDLFAAGGNISVSGTVGDDVRIAGGAVRLSGPVRGDLFVAGGEVHLVSNGSVDGDVIVAGGSVTIEGLVKGDIRASGGKVTLNGQVDGDVRAASENVVLGSRAVIGGNFDYYSRNEAVIADGARVAGATMFHQSRRGSSTALIGLLGAWLILKFLMILVVSLLAVFVFRRFTGKVLERAVAAPAKDFLTGFILLFLVPIAAVLLSITLVGIPIAIAAMLIYAVYLMLSGFLMPVMLGSYINQLITKRLEMNWKTILYGILAIYLLYIIPFVGWIVCFIAYLIVFGALARTWYERVWKSV